MSTLQTVSHDTTAGRAGPRTRPGPVLLLAAAGPLVIEYVAVAALLALITATAPGSTLSTAGVLRAAGPAWLAANHVPIRIGGHELGMLPLLAALLVLTLVARTAANAAQRLDWDTPKAGGRIIAVIAGVRAVFALLVSSITGGATPVIAFFVAGVLAAIGAALGVARRCGLVAAALDRTDDAVATGLRAGLGATTVLLAVGALVFGAGLLGSWHTAVGLFGTAAPGLGSGLGMFLLCLGYLPNVLVGSLSFASGPGFAIGHVVVAQWRFHAGPVPAVPVLAPLPAAVAPWWIFLMLLPIAAGMLAGRRCRVLPGRGARLRAVGVAALVTGLVWLVLAAASGGALAGGPFNPVTVPAGALAVATALFVAVPGGVTVLLTGRDIEVAPDIEEPATDESVAEPEPEPDETDEPEPDEDEASAGTDAEPDTA